MPSIVYWGHTLNRMEGVLWNRYVAPVCGPTTGIPAGLRTFSTALVVAEPFTATSASSCGISLRVCWTATGGSYWSSSATRFNFRPPTPPCALTIAK